MVGHGQKNTNRGQAINRNAARIKKLAEKLAELGKLIKKVKIEAKSDLDEISVVMDEWFTETEERLRLLERPWWKKLLRRDLNQPTINLENLDFENDVLPEIERQAGEIPTEVKEKCKAEAIIEMAEQAKEVEDAEGKEEAAAAGDAESPASDSGPEDARTEEEEGEAGGV